MTQPLPYSAHLAPKKLRRLKNYKERLTVGQYLLKRLGKFGVHALFGRIDEIHLSLLQIMRAGEEEMNFVETKHAFEMAYGFAKINRLGAFAAHDQTVLKHIATLSQAFCENAPLVTILCTKDGLARNEGTTFHFEQDAEEKERKETLDLLIKNGFFIYSVLDDAELAAKKIDRTLDSAYHFQKPICFELSEKMCDAFIPQHNPEKTCVPHSDPEILRDCIRHLKDTLKSAYKPFLCIGNAVTACQAANLATQFAENLGIPICTEMHARGVIVEEHPLFFGLYSEELPQALVGSDTALFCGGTRKNKTTKFNHSVHICEEYTIIDTLRYPHIYLYDVIEQLALSDFGSKKEIAFPKAKQYPFQAQIGSKITLERLVSCILKYIHTILLVTGHVNILSKMQETPFPQGSFLTSEQDADFILPASIGASFVVKDSPHKRRPLALLTDAEFQTSLADLTSALQYGIKPLIVIYRDEKSNLNIHYKALNTFYGKGKIVQTKTEDTFEEALQEALQGDYDSFFLIDAQLTNS